MAADETGVRLVHHSALTANTVKKFHLTGKTGSDIEIVHHGGTVADPLFVTVAATETTLTAAVKYADETEVVLAGERLTIPAPKDDDVWVSIISNGTPGVSVIGDR